MRHFVGFLFGLVLGPVLVLLSGWVFSHLRDLYVSDTGVLVGVGPLALAGLACVGLLTALVVVPVRLTPMLPFAAALTLGGLTALALLQPHMVGRLPDVPGMSGALVLLPLGVFLPLTLLLLAPLFVGQRWVREDEELEEEEYFEGLYDEDDKDPSPTASGPKHRY